MENKVRVIQCKGGITVKITMAKKRYAVEVAIPKQIMKKEIKIRNRQVILRVKIMNKCDEPIKVKMQEDYKLDWCGQICINNWHKFEFKKEGYYNGSISLNPSCYIPTNIRKRVKKYWEEYNKNSKLIKKIPSQNSITSTSSKYTNYSRNNANHPYSGGSVSPK